MRIIAGEFRRRKLLTNPGLTTRPITDRVKESLFENIHNRMTDKRVADIFAGTGTIGFEALSRGARRVTFIERDRIALDLLKQNIAALGCNERTLTWPADVLRCSFRPKGVKAEEFSPFDVIFFDPPYKMVPGMVVNSPLWLSLNRLARPDISSDQATLVLRVPERTKFDLPEQWHVDWSMEMSNMVIHVATKLPVVSDEENASAITSDEIQSDESE